MMMKMDGFDDCIVGVVARITQPTIICYDRGLVIAKLMSWGMTEEEAEEYHEYNQAGAWVGEGTPCFLTRCDVQYIDEMCEEF